MRQNLLHAQTEFSSLGGSANDLLQGPYGTEGIQQEAAGNRTKRSPATEASDYQYLNFENSTNSIANICARILSMNLTELATEFQKCNWKRSAIIKKLFSYSNVIKKTNCKAKLAVKNKLNVNKYETTPSNRLETEPAEFREYCKNNAYTSRKSALENWRTELREEADHLQTMSNVVLKLARTGCWKGNAYHEILMRNFTLMVFKKQHK